MESLKLTAAEVMAATGFKKGRVYDWIKTGKFKTVESPKGKLIITTRAELESLKDIDSSQLLGVVQNSSNQNTPNSLENSNTNYQTNSNQPTQTDVMMKALNLVEDMYSSIDNRTKLLEDSEHRTKENYYELKAKHEVVVEQYQTSIKQLEAENFELRSELTKIKSKWYNKKIF